MRAIDLMPWRLPINLDKPTEPLSEEGINAILEGAMRILEDIGIATLNDEAGEIFKSAGCSVNGGVVRIGREFVMEMLSKAPKTWKLTPCNSEREITVGGEFILFGNVSSPPSYWDYARRKKMPGTREICQNFLKLSQYFNCIHFVRGYPVEPVDIHPSIRHLDVLYDKLTLADKVVHAYSLGKERVKDVMEMVRIAGGTAQKNPKPAPKGTLTSIQRRPLNMTSLCWMAGCGWCGVIRVSM